MGGGRELDDRVNRDGDGGLQKEQHDRQQHDPTGHAEHGGDPGRQQARSAQDSELEGFQSGLSWSLGTVRSAPA